MKRLITYIIVLLVLSSCIGDGKYTAMRKGLDSINMLNRNSQPFTIADVEPYVRFFDNHGTPNDQLLAHYLLGRAYYDHGEAPMAMKCYQEALDCADTTRADCDYAQLCRVYMQMANVFYYQGLYRKQLEYIDNSVKYAWKGGDTLAAIMNYEQSCYAYSQLGNIDSAIWYDSSYSGHFYDESGNKIIITDIPTIDNFEKFLANYQNVKCIYYRSSPTE